MIVLTRATFETVMRALLDSSTPQAVTAIAQLRTAAVEQLARDDEFNNEAPALCRRQAG